MPISLQSLAAKEAEITVELNGDTCVVNYDPNRMSKQFRAEVLRLQREYIKVKRKMEALLVTAMRVEAEDGSTAQQQEDEQAEAAIQDLMAEDDRLKVQIDAAIASIVNYWELTFDTKSSKTVPIWVENDKGEHKPAPELAQVPLEFEAAVLNGIMMDSQQGEADGARTLNSSASGSKRVVKLETSRPRQTGSRRSKRVTGFKR